MIKFIFVFALMGVVASCNLCNSHSSGQLKYSDLQFKQSAETTEPDSIKAGSPGFVLMARYKDLAHSEALRGNYRKAYLLNEKFHRLKDSLNEITNKKSLLNLEIEHQKLEYQKEQLKIENNNLKIYILLTIIIFVLLITGLFLYYRNKELQLQYLKLSENIKHTEWGFLVTKEFITENHIAYDELERILNREKGINNINTELYNRLHDVLTQQKASYSGHLLHRLTHLDGNFGAKFQQLFPDFSTDDFLMASMIHHKWKVTDMTAIFHISPDAVRKRKGRLSQKIAARLNKEIDLDEFLTNL